MIMTKDDLYNPILGKDKDILELFVEFYGEKHREKLTRNHQNTEVYFTEKDPVESIQLLYTAYADDVAEEFFKYLNFRAGSVPAPTDLETVRDVIMHRSFDMFNIGPVADLVSCVEGKEVEPNDVPKYLRNPFHYLKVKKVLDHAIDVWNTQYRDRYEGILDEGRALYESIEQEDRALAQKIADIDGDISRLMLNHTRKIMMSNGEMPFLMDIIYSQALSQVMYMGRDGLSDPFIVDENQKAGIVSLFKALGFDKGDDYEAYITDDGVMNTVFDKKVVGQIEHLTKEKVLQSIVNKPQFKSVQEKVSKLDLAEGDMELLASVCGYLSDSNTGGFNQPHVDRNGNLKPVCICPMGASLDDETLLHELGHAYQSSIVSSSGNVFAVKTGIETYEHRCDYKKFSYSELFANGSLGKGDCVVDHLSTKGRKYRISNEVIHDLLTKLLLELSKKKGYRFGAHDGRGRATIYSYGIDIVKDFVMDNLDFIKDCYMSDNPNVLIDALGREKMDALESILENVVCIPLNKRIAILQEIDARGSNSSHADLAKEGGWSPMTQEYLSQFAMGKELLHGVKLQKSM